VRNPGVARELQKNKAVGHAGTNGFALVPTLLSLQAP
jgi:hypothetical protein